VTVVPKTQGKSDSKRRYGPGRCFLQRRPTEAGSQTLHSRVQNPAQGCPRHRCEIALTDPPEAVASPQAPDDPLRHPLSDCTKQAILHRARNTSRKNTVLCAMSRGAVANDRTAQIGLGQDHSKLLTLGGITVDGGCHEGRSARHLVNGKTMEAEKMSDTSHLADAESIAGSRSFRKRSL